MFRWRSPFRIGCDICFYGDPVKTVEYAVRAERDGFPVVSVPDHTFHRPGYGEPPPFDAFTVLAAIAVRTRHVTLMPVVSECLRRHPVMVAQAFSTMDHLSGGRVALGLGAGEAFNVDPIAEIDFSKPFTRLRESVELIKRLWTSDEPVTYKGETLELRDAPPIIKPLQRPHPPIYVGGMGRRVRRFVGEACDGWMPWLYTPETYRADLKEIEAGCRAAGRSLDDIDLGLNIRAVVLKDGDEARRVAEPGNRIALALRPRLLEALGYPELARMGEMIWSSTFTDDHMARIREVARRIPSEIVEKAAIVGTPDEAIEQIEEFKRAGVKLLALTLMTARFEETERLFRERILPYFAEES
ncbi:LLM class flavin-dependent oxidoreductase [Candidatus Bathyarchaeota archaeon]|nr:LLM class flavin-dependent oxidoreductase [Candidatus Bathyarchaeota archaeon]